MIQVCQDLALQFPNESSRSLRLRVEEMEVNEKINIEILSNSRKTLNQRNHVAVLFHESFVARLTVETRISNKTA